MFDMHCHILPGIDDGAKDLPTSLAMLKIAQQNGTTAIFATPHVIEGKWLPEWSVITHLCEELNQTAQQSHIDIPIYPGGEVAIHLDLLDLLTAPGPYCLNGGRYMLVELPAAEVPRFTEDFFFTLQARGITPILAHAERYPAISANPEVLLEWVRRGLLIQLNGSSLTGRMGQRAMETAEILLRSGLVHVIGSDAHSARTRTPNLTETKAKVTAIVGEQAANILFYDNPRRILSSEDIIAPEVTVIQRPKQKNFFQRLFSNM